MDFELSKCANTDCPIKLFKIRFYTDFKSGIYRRVRQFANFTIFMIKIFMRVKFMSVGVVLDTVLDLEPYQVLANRCG